MKNRGDFGQCYDKFKPFKLVGVIGVGWHGLNRSSTVVSSGTLVLFVVIHWLSGYQLTPRFTLMHHKYSATALRLCCGATVVAP